MLLRRLYTMPNHVSRRNAAQAVVPADTLRSLRALRVPLDSTVDMTSGVK